MPNQIFLIKVTIRKCPKGKWKLLFVLSKSLHSIPVIITNEYYKLHHATLPYKASMKYVMEERLHETHYMSCYVYTELRQTNALEVCEQYVMEIQSGTYTFLSNTTSLDILIRCTIVQNTSASSMIRQSLSLSPYTFTTRKNDMDSILKNHVDSILSGFRKLFTDTPQIIFYDKQLTGLNPIMTPLLCLHQNEERSNERFWLRILNILEQIYVSYGIKFDIHTVWIEMCTIITTLCHGYIYERQDIYMESWYTRYYDCDEGGLMAYILYRMFTNAEFKDRRLQLMQNIAKQYYCFWAFWYVQAPSMGSTTTTTQQMATYGHWSMVCIKKSYFVDHLHNSSQYKNLKQYLRKKTQKQSTITITATMKHLYESLPPILVGESTAFTNANITREEKQVMKIPKVYKNRRLHFSKHSNYYISLNCLYTSYFYEKFNIPIFGFFCGSSQSNNQLHYKISYRNLQHPHSASLHFYPFPATSSRCIAFCKGQSNYRIAKPPCIIHENGSFEKSIETNEPIQLQMTKILQFLNGFPKQKHPSRTPMVILSYDDLLDKKVQASIKEKFSAITYTIYEIIQRSYICILQGDKRCCY